MRRSSYLSYFLSIFCLFGLSTGQNYDLLESTASELASTEDAEYSCIFINKWSASRHPIDYPSNAHWSPPVLIAHNSSYHAWQAGVLALDGVQSLAERGATGGVLSRASRAGFNNVMGFSQFNRELQNQTLPSISVSATAPLLSGLSMIAPSPDWFSGMDSFDPRSGDVWLQSFAFDTFAWDSGTDDGVTYNSGDIVSDPFVDVFQLTEESVPANGVLLNAAGTEVLPVASWQCSLSTIPCGIDSAPCAVDSECCSGLCAIGDDAETGECLDVPKLTLEEAIAQGNSRRNNLKEELQESFGLLRKFGH